MGLLWSFTRRNKFWFSRVLLRFFMTNACMSAVQFNNYLHIEVYNVGNLKCFCISL